MRHDTPLGELVADVTRRNLNQEQARDREAELHRIAGKAALDILGVQLDFELGKSHTRPTGQDYANLIYAAMKQGGL